MLARLESGNIDLVLTDPPYTISKNTGFKNCGTRGVKRLRVNMDFGEWDKSMIDLPQLARLVYSCLRKGGTAIIWYDLWTLSYLSQAMLEAGFKQRRLIVWEKSNPVPLNQRVNYLTNSREIALLGVKGSNPTFNEKYHSGVFRMPIPRDGGKRLHPTQKPLQLFNELVRIHSNPKDTLNKLGEGFSRGYRGSFAGITRLPGPFPRVFALPFRCGGAVARLTGPAEGARPDLGPLRPRQPASCPSAVSRLPSPKSSARRSVFFASPR